MCGACRHSQDWGDHQCPPPPTSPCTRRGLAPPGPAPGAGGSGGHSRHALSPNTCPSRRCAWQHPGDPSRGRGSRGRPPRHLLHRCPEPTLPSPRSLSKNPFSKPRPHTRPQSRPTAESVTAESYNSLISAKLHPFCFISINREFKSNLLDGSCLAAEASELTRQGCPSQLTRGPAPGGAPCELRPLAGGSGGRAGPGVPSEPPVDAAPHTSSGALEG